MESLFIEVTVAGRKTWINQAADPILRLWANEEGGQAKGAVLHSERGGVLVVEESPAVIMAAVDAKHAARLEELKAPAAEPAPIP